MTYEVKNHPMDDKAEWEKLGDKNKRFIDEYLVDLNQTQAYIRAGYSSKSARGASSKCLAKDHIQAALRHRKRMLAQEYDVSEKSIIAEMARVAFFNMEDIHDLDEDGHPVLSMKKAGRKHYAAIKEVTSRYYKEGKGPDALAVKEVTIKTHDKVKALISLGQQLGMFASKKEVSGPGGGPIEQSHHVRKIETNGVKADWSGDQEPDFDDDEDDED